MSYIEKNPFDLDEKRDGPDRVHKSKVWTLEEQEEKLKGYLEIPPEFWDLIKHNSHVRYFTKEDGFRPGGFVLQNPFDYTPKGGNNERRAMKFQNGFYPKAPGYAQWIAAYEDVTKFYMKSDASVSMMLQSLEIAIKGLNDNIRKLADHSKKNDARITALESQFK